MNFVHLHIHSTYSMLEGLGKIGKIIDKLKEQGAKAAALTDYNGLFGSIERVEYCGKAGIKPIIGCELGFSNEISSQTHQGTIVLIAQNNEGYKNLLKLVSIANTEGTPTNPKIDWKNIQNHKDGLFCIIGGEKSIIGNAIIQGKGDDLITDTITSFKNIFGDKLFLEILAQDYNINKTAKAINDMVLEISTKLNIELTISNNVHFIKQGDNELFEVALAIRDGLKRTDQNRRKINGDYSLIEFEKIKMIMIKNSFEEEKINEYAKNTNKISDLVDVKINLGETHFPTYVSPEEIKKLYEQNKDTLEVE